MTLLNAIRQLLTEFPSGLTPQELRTQIKDRYPELFGTESHRANVEKGHYQSLDHALLAQIYVYSRNASDIVADRSTKPMRLFLEESEGGSDVTPSEESLGTEDLEKLEAGIGTVYVLGTNTFTRDGQEIVKIGITTGPVQKRVDQLYNTSAAYKFRVIKEHQTKGYAELEQSLHRLLDRFRISKSREYFTAACLPFVDEVIELHTRILDTEAPVAADG